LNEVVNTGSFIATVDEISLSYQDYFVTFEFSVLDYTKPRENRYAFQLKGFDEEWVNSGTRRSATYTSLPAGHYELRVKGANSSGVWSEDNLAIGVHVAPPFWGTIWFRLASVFAVSGMVLAVYQLRTRDIQKRNQQLEAANAQLNEEINRRAAVERENQRVIAEIQERNAEMERFTYTVSHDLKSPLITIQAFLGLVEREADSGELDRMKHDMGRIRRAAGKMNQLLDELLDLSRVGRVDNQRERVSMTELAQEALSLTTGRIRGAGARVEIASDLPQVVVDRPRLVEVLQDLIDNAVKYTDAEAPRVEVGCRPNGDEVVFFVRDNGIGIEPRYQEKIFGLFEQLNPSGEGTGIGLALVHRIIKVHGGRIWVDSEGQGKGSTFYFTLPEVAV
ncbi:MAG: ATP-binding protein, partial [Acidobacteriota bacterium]